MNSCTNSSRALLLMVAVAAVSSRAPAQIPQPLDPTRNLPFPAPAQPHVALPEQYLWTAGDVTALRPDHGKFPWNRPNLRIEPHYFRAHFNLTQAPRHATLYLAGPREAHVYLNGVLIADFYSNPDQPIGFHVFHADVSSGLRQGANVLAISAIRGRGIVAGAGPAATAQLAYGEVLAAKIVPAEFGGEASPVLISDRSWRSSAVSSAHWSDTEFDETSWKPAQSLGPIESDVDFFQWNADAGMYGWPGYRGMSAALRTYALPAASVTHVFTGSAKFSHLESLTAADSAAPFTVTFSPQPTTDAESPTLLLDFGREVAGRLLVESASTQEATLSIAYGESEIEALATGLTPGQQGGNYLGTNLLEVPAHGVARGPKSGFRYVRIRFLRGAPITAFKSIRLEGMYYPAAYAGSFESSDAELNRIWETGAYTAHLCMQDGVWDAPKRDRGRWAGDLVVEGRVIGDVFGDNAPMEETLHGLAPADPSQVNGIPGYSALWITALYDLYSRSGDKDFIAGEHDALLRVLSAMDASLDADGVFTNAKHQWLFVDWAPGLYGYTREAIIGTSLQYVLAYNRASLLLRMLGDAGSAEKYSHRSADLLDATRTRYRDRGAFTYGTTWQLNALALLAFDNEPAAGPALWTRVFSHVKQDSGTDQAISPYFNAYLIDAVARTDHRREALDWLRTYWGGMLAEGATSFWESYDLRWPRTNPHLSLQADGTSGYFVSMAHGWSSGPTAWLTENILGVREPQDGYKTVTIEPDLEGLDWVRGTVPTPQGPIRIGIDKRKGVALDLPPGIEHAFVGLPFGTRDQKLYVDGSPVERVGAMTGYRVDLRQAGHHTLQVR